MHVKPAEGRMVRRPDTLVHLQAEGEEVPHTEFWVRRLRDGDVIETDAHAGDARGQFFEIPKAAHAEQPAPTEEPQP